MKIEGDNNLALLVDELMEQVPELDAQDSQGVVAITGDGSYVELTPLVEDLDLAPLEAKIKAVVQAHDPAKEQPVVQTPLERARDSVEAMDEGDVKSALDAILEALGA